METKYFYEYFRKILKDNEEIFLIAKAKKYSEGKMKIIYGYGLFPLEINDILLIFTTERIFFIPFYKGKAFKTALIQRYYSNLVDMKIEGNKLKMVYQKGKEEVLKIILKEDILKIKNLFSNIFCKINKSSDKYKVFLCPKCLNQLRQDEYFCQNCGVTFKSKKKLLLSGLIFPCWTELYLGFFKKAIFLALYDILLLFLIIFSLSETLKGKPQYSLGLIILIIFFVMYRIFYFLKSLFFRKILILDEKS